MIPSKIVSSNRSDHSSVKTKAPRFYNRDALNHLLIIRRLSEDRSHQAFPRRAARILRLRGVRPRNLRTAYIGLRAHAHEREAVDGIASGRNNYIIRLEDWHPNHARKAAFCASNQRVDCLCAVHAKGGDISSVLRGWVSRFAIIFPSTPFPS